MIFKSEEETLAWAEEFGKSLKAGDMVALYGNLGAGKTVMSRGICKGLGFEGAVCSPTYTIRHEYLEPGTELYEVGFDHDYLAKGISLIEWPERLEGETGDITHKISIEIVSENEREVTLEKFDRQ